MSFNLYVIVLSFLRLIELRSCLELWDFFITSIVPLWLGLYVNNPTVHPSESCKVDM